MKREDPISALTMTRNKTRLHGLEEEEGAPGENTTHEGGNTDDEIVNFTLEVEDTKALPTQAQPQEQPQVQQQALAHALDRLDLILDHLDHM